jgi:hypothetical protein
MGAARYDWKKASALGVDSVSGCEAESATMRGYRA